jgi:hypothetical protein
MSDHFMKEPVLTLETMEDVRNAIADPNREVICGFKGLDIYRIKSLWLISLIDELSAAKKAKPKEPEIPGVTIITLGGDDLIYNADIKRLAEKRLGFPEKPDAAYSQEQNSLSTLIYNAQNYRRSDRLIAEGYEPFTAELRQKAFETGKQIEMFGENMLGGSVTARLKVKQVDGALYAMLPKKRNRHYAPQGQPVRLVA